MVLILISLLFISTFSFIGFTTLGYGIFLWEKKKVEQLTRNIIPYSGRSDEMAKRSFSTNDLNSDSNNYNEKMKIPTQLNQYFERTIVTVKKQNYKSKFQKIIIFAAKISKNLGFYIKIGIQYILKLSKIETKQNLNKQNNKYYNNDTKLSDPISSSSEPKFEVKSEVKPSYQQKFAPNNFEEKHNSTKQKKHNENGNYGVNQSLEKISFEPKSDENIPQKNNQKTKTSTFATIDMLNIDREESQNYQATTNKNTDKYEKIENSILKRLQEVGLNNYDIWLELANHYQKHQENEKAKEIYAMVLKHAQGKEKEMAMNGLIALN